MKYFKNISTAEELKKQFRAYCVSMHPDKGGDPEEFKAMMAEYNGIIKNFERAKEEARAEEGGSRVRTASLFNLIYEIGSAISIIFVGAEKEFSTRTDT